MILATGCETCSEVVREALRLSEKTAENDWRSSVYLRGQMVLNVTAVTPGPNGWAVLLAGDPVRPCPCGSSKPALAVDRDDGYSVEAA